jgi:hypothetical protein
MMPDAITEDGYNHDQIDIIRINNSIDISPEPVDPPPPREPVDYTLSVTISDLTATFNVEPLGVGTLDFGDESGTFSWSANEDYTHDYEEGTYTATFTPAHAEDTGSSVEVTVVAPVEPTV